MKWYLAVFCLIAASASAQQAGPSPQALGQEVMECIGGRAMLRDRITQLEAEIAKLKAPPAEAEPDKK